MLEFGAGTDTLVLDWTCYCYGIADSGLPVGSLAAGYSGNFNTSYGSTYRVYFNRGRTFRPDLDRVINTVDGNDIVRGNGGGDVLRTARGTDTIDGGAGDDRWVANKGFLSATQAMVLDLTNAGIQATYLGTATIRSIEMLTLITEAGNDIITSLSAGFDDSITTNGGTDWVTVAGGRDIAHLGIGRDWLVLDWSG